MLLFFDAGRPTWQTMLQVIPPQLTPSPTVGWSVLWSQDLKFLMGNNIIGHNFKLKLKAAQMK